MVGDSISHSAAVVAPGRLLHSLEHQDVGIINTGQDESGSDVVVPVLFQDLTLKRTLRRKLILATVSR